MKILYVIESLIDGGASKALLSLCAAISQKGFSTQIFTQNIDQLVYDKFNVHFDIKTGDAGALKDLKIKNNYDVIHWFRTNSSKLFDIYFTRFTQDLRPPLILTHCQIPTRHDLRLSNYELKFADKFVFITKTGYSHHYNRVIPESKKQLIYFGTHNIDLIEQKRTYKVNGILKFGRGSDLVKCPDDLIKVYESLGDYPIEFYIVGDGSENEKKKLSQKINKSTIRNQVHLIDHLADADWIKYLRSLDVFIYYLPPNAYSAIDGVIQDAMLTGLPVVYLGPKATKELFTHGEDALVANNVDEFISYCYLLAENKNERIRLGQNARTKILKEFNYQKTVEQYLKLYKTDCHGKIEMIDLNLSYQLMYYWSSFKYFLYQKKEGIKYRLRNLTCV